jgi:hypothetical protein
MPLAGDWVAFYKQNLPVRNVLVGKSKGRSIKALRERVNALSLDPSTRSQATTLGFYHEKLKVAHAWRGGKIVHTLSDAGYKSDAEMLMAEVSHLPADICQHTLKRHLDRHKTSQSWGIYASASMPFKKASDHAKYDLLDAMMRYLPRVDKWRLYVCQGSLIEQHLCVWVREGADRSSQMLALLLVLEVELAKEDPFDMDQINASFYNEVSQVVDGLKAIVQLSFASSPQAAIVALGKCQYSTKHASPTELVATAIADCAWYKDRKDKYLQALPSIMEYEDVLVENGAILDKLPNHFDKEWVECHGATTFGIFAEMLNSLSIMLGTATLEFDGLRQYHKALTDKATSLASALKSLVAAREMECGAALDEAMKMLHAACVVFPLEHNYPECIQVLADFKSSAAYKAREEAFAEVLRGVVMTNEDHKKDYSTVTILKAQIAPYAGMQVPEATSVLVTGIAMSICALMKAMPWDAENFDLMMGVASSLLEFAPVDTTSRHALRCLRCWRAAQQAVLHTDCDTITYNELQSLGKVLEDLRVVALTPMNPNTNVSCDEVRLFTEMGYFKFLCEFELATKAVTNRATSNLAEAIKPLQHYVDLASDGSNTWQLTTQSFKTLQDFAKLIADKSLFSAAHEDIPQSMARVDDAISQYKAVLGLAASVTIDEDPKLVAADLISIQALKLNVELNLLQAFQDKADTDKLRATVQAQIRRLRGKEIKEKTALHAIVYKQAFAALTHK